MDDNQIKQMVSRFLVWRLPENFQPDGGISFNPMFNEHTDPPMQHEPSGTNLLNYQQAEAMVRHMVEGIPETQAAVAAALMRARDIAATKVQAWLDAEPPYSGTLDEIIADIESLPATILALITPGAMAALEAERARDERLRALMPEIVAALRADSVNLSLIRDILAALEVKP